MELRPGYKQTEMGVIPEDWTVKTLGELGQFKNGINKGKEDFGHGFPFVNLMDVFGIPKVSTAANFGLVNSSVVERKLYELRGGDVLFVRSSVKPEGVGLTTLIPEDLPDTVFSGFLIRYRDNDQLAHEFKEHCFWQAGFRSRLVANSTVSANTNINQDALKALQIAFPSEKEEQRAIAGALGDVDALLGALTQLIAKKRDLKQAAMQQLLTGSQRLPGFSGEWEVKRIGDLFQFLNTANNPRADLSEFGDVGYIHYGDIHTSVAVFLDCVSEVLPLIAKTKVPNIPLLQDGDLVMADASEDYEGIGKCVEIRNASGRKIVAGLHTFLLRGNRNLLLTGSKVISSSFHR